MPFEAEQRVRRIGVRMTPREASALRSAAEKRRCTITEVIVQLLEQAGELARAAESGSEGAA